MKLIWLLMVVTFAYSVPVGMMIQDVIKSISLQKYQVPGLNSRKRKVIRRSKFVRHF
jgi:hypothetical protein